MHQDIVSNDLHQSGSPVQELVMALQLSKMHNFHVGA